MQKYADYIKQIEIESLWSGTKHILWNLDRRVNILSGVNLSLIHISEPTRP